MGSAGSTSPVAPRAEVSRDLVERPGGSAEALAGPPLDRVDVGVERTEAGRREACRAGAEGRQHPVPGPGQPSRTAGAMRFHGGTSPGPETRRHERREARPSGGRAPRGRRPAAARHRARRASRGRRRAPAARGSGGRSRAGGRGARPGPRRWRRRPPRRARPAPRRARAASRGPRPGAGADRRPGWRRRRRRRATRGSRAPARPAVELRPQAIPRGGVGGVRHRATRHAARPITSNRGARRGRRV